MNQKIQKKEVTTMASLLSFISEVWATHPGTILFAVAVCAALAVLEYTENVRPKKKSI